MRSSNRPEPAREKRKGRLMIWSRDRWNTLSRGCGSFDALRRRRRACLALADAFGGGPAPVAEDDAVPKSAPAPRGAAAGRPRRHPGGRRRRSGRGCLGQALHEERPDPEQGNLPHQSRGPRAQYRHGADRRRRAQGRGRGKAAASRQGADRLCAGDAGRRANQDRREQPIQLQYPICFPTSCQVQLELTKELFDKMRKGKQMVVAAMNIQQKTMGFPVPLTGFAKAYRRPAGRQRQIRGVAAPADGDVPQAPGRARRQGGRGRAEEEQAGRPRSSRRPAAAAPTPPAQQKRPPAPAAAISAQRERFRHSTKAAPVSRAAFSFARIWHGARSVLLQEAKAEDAVLQILEQLRHLRMAQRLVGGVGHEVLLRHIGDIFGVGVLREQVIEGLILVGPDLLREWSDTTPRYWRRSGRRRRSRRETDRPGGEPPGRSGIWRCGRSTLPTPVPLSLSTIRAKLEGAVNGSELMQTSRPAPV